MDRPPSPRNPTKRRKLSIASSSGDPEPENDDACASALPTPPPSSQLTAFSAAERGRAGGDGRPALVAHPGPREPAGRRSCRQLSRKTRRRAVV